MQIKQIKKIKQIKQIEKIKRISIKTSICVLLCIVLSTQTIVGVVEPINEEEVQVKLQEIEAEKLAIIEELFGIEQSINTSEKKKSEIETVIEDKNAQISLLEEEIKAENLVYEQLITNLEDVLTSYQRMGSTSMIGIILESDNLKDFVRRISVLRDFSRQTDVLMTKIQDAIVVLETSKSQLLTEQAALETSKQELEQAVKELLKLQDEKENYLVALEEERLYYEEQLNALTDAWKQLKPIFKQASSGFSELVDSGALTEDMIEVEISLLGIKATILDDKFNQAIVDYEKLPDMVFMFQTDEVDITLLDGVLELQGEFQVKDDFELKYVAKSGVFYGVPLEKSALVELFEEGELILDIRKLTLNNKVKDIQIEEGKMILNIAFSFF